MWIFLDPTPRWNAARCSPEIRPYCSLPRGQDINNYPNLLAHQMNQLRNKEGSMPPGDVPTSPKKHSPAKRSHSEDVYSERLEAPLQNIQQEKLSPKNERNCTTNETQPQKTMPVRINPLIKYAAERQATTKVSRYYMKMYSYCI